MMTLDDAIKHAEEVAQENDNVDENELALMYCDDTECIENHKARCKECASEHRQLAEWLKELKELNRILYASEYTENGITYSYCYDNDSRVKHMRETSKEI